VVAVISDTHLPKGARRLPSRCVALLAGADAAIHAGDIATLKALREIEAICPTLYAVHGNIDEPALRRRLPGSRQIVLDRRTVAATHDAGPARGRLLTRRRSCSDTVTCHSTSAVVSFRSSTPAARPNADARLNEQWG
jgi:uncharacterized protein